MSEIIFHSRTMSDTLIVCRTVRVDMRGFSDGERRDIENRLLETARELFSRYGFQKTTVHEITEPVGIAEGTFYQFFDSKSEIYMRVLIREQDEVIDTVESDLQELTDPEEQLDHLFRIWAKEFEQRPLLLESHRAPQEIVQAVDGREFPDAKQAIMDRMSALIEDIQSKSDGYITEISPELVFELLSLIEYIAAHRDAYDELGWSGYDLFKETLIRILQQGLLENGP